MTSLAERSEDQGAGAPEGGMRRLPAGARNPGDGRERARIMRAIEDEWLPRLASTRDAWAASLPADAATDWPRGAVYVRVSSARSLARDSPDNQLLQALALMAQRRYYVAPDAVFFDVESGTDIGPRVAFLRLREAAVAGGFKAIGAFINERMFRNLEQSLKIKREFRMSGIELVYLGKYEGDQRNPAAWQLETMQDQTAELHARNTSYYVGLTFEAASRAGRPVGKVPEVYRERVRAASFMGRRGSVVSWDVAEPLGSVMQEGCRRYLEGASYTDLGKWAATTELQGVTPGGRVMDSRWWRMTLTNPRFAGYQVPTVYMGFKPGRESPARPRRTAESELVPCALPALWTLDDYRSVLAIGTKRRFAAKVRPAHRQYLLSGVATDAGCGHLMEIVTHTEDRYWMKCPGRASGAHLTRGIRVDVAAAELDELIAGIRLDDADLLRQIEEELRELSRRQQDERQRFRPDPAIASLRQALALVQTTGGQGDIQADLERRIASMESADAARREAFSEPLVQFRRALARLEDWSGVWSDADVAAKNKLLRDAGVKVAIAEGAGEKRSRKPGDIVRISAANPAFQFALGVALSSPDSRAYGSASAAISTTGGLLEICLSPAFADIPAVGMLGSSVPIVRPEVRDPHDTTTRMSGEPDGPWLTVAQAAAALGMPRGSMSDLIGDGSIPVRRLQSGRRPWVFLRQGDVESFRDQHPERLGGGGRDRVLGALDRGRWIGVAEVATVLGLTVRQVYHRRDDGRLPFAFARVSGRLYAREAEVLACVRDLAA